jgi:hypothetical protein
MPILKPIRGLQLNKSHPLARGLVGCWLLNEGTGHKVFDLSGNSNTATTLANSAPPWIMMELETMLKSPIRITLQVCLYQSVCGLELTSYLQLKVNGLL